MEIEFRLPGPDDPFAPPKPRPEDLGPDDLGNRGVLRAGLDQQGQQMKAEFAELEAARRKAEEEIELERAGVDLTLEGLRLAGLPEEEGVQESDPLRAFADFAKRRIAALPEGAREAAALHAGQERLKLDRAWRGRRHNAQVKRLQAGVDQSLGALTIEAGREPARLPELAERGFGLLQATGESLRFDENQNKAVRGRFGALLAEAALRAMAPKQALAALESGAIEALLPDAAVRETLRSELTAAEANERRALKAETAGLRALHLAQLDRGEPGVPEIERDVEIDFGVDEARAFNEQAEVARQRHRLRRQWQLAPESEIAAGLEGAEATGDPEAARTVAEEIRTERQRDPAAVAAEDPKLQALLAAAEDDPAQRELTTGISLELQKELGVPETGRRVLTQQGLADLTAQIEAAPPAQRAALLQQVKEAYGVHYDRVLSELEGARLDPTALALARRLDDPVAAQRLAALQGKDRAALTEGLDPGEAKTVAAAARAAVPGPSAPAAERVALARYQHTGDLNDAVALARETVGDEGTDMLAGGAGDDDGKEDDAAFQDRGRDLRDAFLATVTPEPLDRAVEDLETAQARAEQGQIAFPDTGDGDVRIGDSILDAKTAGLLEEALSVQAGGLDAFLARVGRLSASGEFTGEQLAAIREVARRSSSGGFLDPAWSQGRKRSRSGELLRALDKRMAVRQRFSESIQRIVEGGALRNPRARGSGPNPTVGIGGKPDRPDRTSEEREDPKDQASRTLSEERAAALDEAVAKGNGRVVRVDKTEKRVFASQSTELHLKADEIMAADVVRTGRPLGFDGVVDSFPSLRDKLLAGVPAKFGDAEIGLRGSAIHGNKWNDSVKVHDGPFFDTALGAGGRKQPSDFDFFLVSPELWRRGLARGIIRDPNKKTPLSEEQLRQLGLGRLNQVLKETEGRKGNIRLFPSREALESEGSFMLFLSPEKVR